MILSQCVWNSQEAVEIVERHRAHGNDYACKELIRIASARWIERQKYYRDDVSNICLSPKQRMMNYRYESVELLQITATVISLPWPRLVAK
jgi:hypothetical protein